MKSRSFFLLFSVFLFLAGNLDAQSFQNPQRISTGQDPVSVFTVDVNGDGIPDLLYETQGNSTTPSSMNIVFGQSSGGFLTGPTLNLPQYVGGCRPLDANQDGKTDLVCLYWVDTFDMQVVTFLGNGDGTFQTPIYSATMESCINCDNGFTAWMFPPAHLTGSGIPDLLVGDYLDGWVFVLLGDGTGKFTVKTVLGGYPYPGVPGLPADAGAGITVADISGDGKPDLLFSSGPTILLGNGDGTFKAPVTVGNESACVFHDMDGDGHPDAVCANLFQGNKLDILHGNADGSFNATPIFTKSYNTGDLPQPVAVLDLNGDGIADIVADSSDGLEVLLGEPGLKFADPVHYAVGYPASNGEQSSILADMNQDGHLDVVAAGPNGIYIGYGNADGTFKAAPGYEFSNVLGHVTVADFNGDGIPDLAATGDQSIELSLGNGDGTFTPYVALPNSGIDFSAGGSPGGARIVHGDFRGNGKQDILAIGSPATYTYFSYILFGNGDGTFESPLQVPDSGVVFPTYDTMAVLDIDKDGRDDVLTADSGHIYATLSKGDGTFKAVSTSVPANGAGLGPSFPVFADFSHSGKLDAAYGLTTSVQILKGHGDGSFDSTGVNLPLPSYQGASPLSSSTVRVTTGDFDGDGNPDVAALAEIVPQAPPWTSEILTVAYVYYGKGDGTFSAPVLAGAFNREYAGIFAADVNKDGRSDLILQSYGSVGFLAAPSGDALGVLLSKPGRTFGPEVDYTGGPYQSGLAIADLNGDGYPDLLAVNSGSFPNGDSLSLPPNTVTVLLNLGAQATGTLVPTTTALASSCNPAAIGASITFTATVTSSTPGHGAPSGSVVFADQKGGSFPTSVPLVAVDSTTASASFSPAAIVVGASDVSATYSGDAVFAASEDSLTQTVTGNPVTITFTATPNPVTAGQPVVLNAGVANAAGSSVAAPTGTVTFSDGSTGLSGPIALTAGTASYSATLSAAGTQTLTATYSGDALHSAGTATFNEQVVSAPIGGAAAGDWTWMGGSNAVEAKCPGNEGDCGLMGAYGARGGVDAGNFPGGRSDAANWTDKSGNLWIFGGNGVTFPWVREDAVLNDLWEFSPSTNLWAWMGGSNQAGSNTGTGDPRGVNGFDAVYGWPGVYGTQGTAASGNVPGSRFGAASWSDSSGNLWLLGGSGLDGNNAWGLENDLWEFNPATLQWTWMGGSDAVGSNCLSSDSCGQPGVYGVQGVPAAGNFPGGRLYSTYWTDHSGNFWLFGGQGVDSVGNWGLLNDLWVFNPSTNEWTWMSGSSTLGGNSGRDWTGQTGVFGTLGVPDPANIPSGRNSAAAWTDSGGNLWLMGGNGITFLLDDLWEYNTFTNEWTWAGGTQNGDPYGMYGTEGTFGAANLPGAHVASNSWTDKDGNLWLFGGEGLASAGYGGPMNDLWEYSIFTGEWVWMGGSSLPGADCVVSGYCGWGGVYGSEGTPDATNQPGSRESVSNWTDSQGNFWLFGGAGFDATGTGGLLYDLWVYQPASGSPAAATPTFSVPTGTYATAQKVTIGDTTPGAVIYYTTDGTAPNVHSAVYSTPILVAKTEAVEAIATAPGYSYSSIATADYTISLPAAATPTFGVPAGNYTTAQTVTIGDTTPGAVIYYTTDGTTPTAGSAIYSNAVSVSTSETLQAIATATGFANSAVATASYTITLPAASTPTFSVPAGSYATAQTVTIGDTTPGAVIHYTINGTTPTASSAVYSSPISVSTSETVKAIATASGYSASPVASAAYTITASAGGTADWTWMGGDSTVPNSNEGGYAGAYGTKGTPAAANIPGSRTDATTWTDGNGNLWLFGGGGCDSAGNWGSLNDLWEYDISTREWTWKSGSSTLPNNSGVGAQPGVYGILGVAAAGNVPGGRAGALGWIDASGNLWLFGGVGHDSAGIYGYLNDLWKFNPSTSEWTWVAGSSTLPNTYSVNSAPGVYGTMGVPAPGNTPGGRVADVGWTDRSGNLWLFGAGQYTFDGFLGALNDLWEFNPSTAEWEWVSGSDAMSCTTTNGSMYCTPPAGVYGSAGIPAAGNTPGSRGYSARWVDGSGNLWLFGGISEIFSPTAPSVTNTSWNDLWEFNPLTRAWAWMGGSSVVSDCVATAGTNRCGQPGVFGTLGVFAAANSPGGISVASAWTDNTGNLWLFGGQGPDSPGNIVDLNSLWELNPSTNEWAWVGGSSTADQPGVYGTLGVPAVGNIPGARTNASAWTDRNGNFWLFGGWGYDSAGVRGYPNDLWRYGSATSNLPLAATPTFSVPAGSYTTAQTVTISDATPGVVIYYTTDGTTPATSSAVYGGPITVSASETVEAIATASGYSTSFVASAAYTVAASTTTTLAVSANTLTAGQPLTLTATVAAPAGAAPTGSVTFNNGAASLGTASLNGSGVATLTLTPAVGSYSMTASYGGSTTDAASTSSPAIAVTVAGVGSIATTTKLTTSATTLTAGQSVTLTATLTAATGSAPGGFVTFLNGTTSVGIVVLQPNGTAKLTLTPVSGSYSITASYAAYLSWQASVSPSIQITVTGTTTGSPDIYTYAGDGTKGFSGDNGSSLSAELWWPAGEGMDAAGNLYFADIVNSRVRKVDASTGIITTIAGNGKIGYGGDGGPALGASFSSLQGVVLDKAGNIYIPDDLNNRVRRIDASTGIITTIAGTGTPGSSGNGGPAVAAELYWPTGVAVNSAGDVYISNLGNNLIQKVDAATGNISIVAGTGDYGYNGDGIPATKATVWAPYGVGLDPAGNLYIMDGGNFRVRRVDAATGTITTVAGKGIDGFSGDGGPATSAAIGSPAGDIVFDTAGNLFFEDTENNRVRRVDAATGIITTYAGDGAATYGGDGGPANQAQIQSPNGLVFDAAGNLYIGDTFNQRIRRVGASPTVKSIATITTLSASAASLAVGQPLTLTATLTPASGATPTGTVTFKNGAASLGTANLNANGVATLTLTPPAGSYSITASYEGSATDAASTSSPAIAVSVNAIATTTSLTASSNAMSYGQTLVLTATVASSSGAAPTGSVSFNNGAASLGTADLNANGVATLTLTPAAGSYSVTASYGGSAADAASTSSPAIAVTVSSVATTTSLMASSNAMFYGQTLVLTATVAPSGGAMPTGTVTFHNGTALLGTASLNGSGIAAFTLTPGVGSYSITASYGGSPTDAPSDSAAVAVNVTAAATATALTASPNPAPFGAAVMLAVTVSSSAPAPGGSVSFYDGASLLGTATVASGAASYSTSGLSVGSHSITAAYGGGNGFNASTSDAVVEVISPADFSISASPGAQTIYTGEAASYTVTITPGTGFNLPVALSCSQLPVNTTCTFSPATVAGGSGSSKLTVQTSAPGKTAIASVLSTKVAVPMLAGLLLLFIPRRLRRYRNSMSVFLALCVSIVLGAAITGCSGPGALTGGTPVGAQSVTVTGSATNGSQTLTHATTVTLNVKSLF